MAEAGRAIDDALAHLDSLISRLQSNGNAAVPSDLKEEKVSPALAAPPPKVTISIASRNCLVNSFFVLE